MARVTSVVVGSFVFGLLSSSSLSIAAEVSATGAKGSTASSPSEAQPEPTDGVSFLCPPEALDKLATQVEGYFDSLGISPSLYAKRLDRGKGTVNYVLRTPKSDVSTLNFYTRPEFAIRDDIVPFPKKGDKQRASRTVSKKEIMLALLQHGRLTTFKSPTCDAEALKDHVGIRQNIVAWTEEVDWVWPKEKGNSFHRKYWSKNLLPLKGVPLALAFMDMWDNGRKYAIYCLEATKSVVIQGVLDYFHRIKKDEATARMIEQRLMAVNGNPLMGVGPGGFFPTDSDGPGKIVKRIEGVAPGNFIPGDWSYFVNPDPESSEKTGYEGSNFVYLGRNKIDEYYGEHGHSYTIEEKLEEVYQWRHQWKGQVGDRSRGEGHEVPLTLAEAQAFLKSPPAGFLYDYRRVPYLFGAEDLPELPATPVKVKR